MYEIKSSVELLKTLAFVAKASELICCERTKMQGKQHSALNFKFPFEKCSLVAMDFIMIQIHIGVVFKITLKSNFAVAIVTISNWPKNLVSVFLTNDKTKANRAL